MITKTGIVATLGPASSDQNLIRQFIANGVTTFRLNFSHGDESTHEALLNTIREMDGEFPHAVAVMGDLCGPKIRTRSIAPDGAMVQEGVQVIITAEDEIGTPARFSTNHPNLIEDVQTDQRILLNEGNLVLRAEQKEGGHLLCRVVIGGPVHSRSGINLPDTQVSLPAITPRDWQWVDWAVEHELDYLALSFVQRAEEVLQLRRRLEEMSSRIKVVAKIEKVEESTGR
jgi:pyruvate kinase